MLLYKHKEEGAGREPVEERRRWSCESYIYTCII